MSLKFIFHSGSSIGTALLSAYLDEYINKHAKSRKSLAHSYFSPILIYSFSCIYAFVYSLIMGKKINLSKKNHKLNILCGLLFAVHVFLASYSLKYISFPLKIIFTSAKLLIAMPTTALFRVKKQKIKGTILGYSMKEILVSISIFIGIVLVLLDNDKTKLTSSAFDFQWKGVIMSIVSNNLACIFDELQSMMLRTEDSGGAAIVAATATAAAAAVTSGGGSGSGSAEGATAAVMTAKAKRLPDNEVVLAWNMLSTVCFLSLGVVTFGLTSKIKNIIVNDTRIFFLATIMGVMNVLTQVVLVSLKKKYGTWWKNIISSFRKCLSILLSIIFFRHPVRPLQAFGIVFVIVCIMLAGQIEMERGQLKSKALAEKERNERRKTKRKEQKEARKKKRERKEQKEREKESKGRKGKRKNSREEEEDNNEKKVESSKKEKDKTDGVEKDDINKDESETDSQET